MASTEVDRARALKTLTKKYQFSLELKYTFLGIGSRFAMHNGGIIHPLPAGTVSREELILFSYKLLSKQKSSRLKFLSGVVAFD
jgi:hypothetical protein